MDERVISSYPSLKSGATVNLLRLPPWELHVTDMYGKQHTVAVPSTKPKVMYATHASKARAIGSEYKNGYNVRATYRPMAIHVAALLA